MEPEMSMELELGMVMVMSLPFVGKAAKTIAAAMFASSVVSIQRIPEALGGFAEDVVASIGAFERLFQCDVGREVV